MRTWQTSPGLVLGKVTIQNMLNIAGLEKLCGLEQRTFGRRVEKGGLENFPMISIINHKIAEGLEKLSEAMRLEKLPP